MFRKPPVWKKYYVKGQCFYLNADGYANAGISKMENSRSHAEMKNYEIM